MERLPSTCPAQRCGVFFAYNSYHVQGHYDVVVQLLRAGADVNLVNLQVDIRLNSK